MKQSSVIFIVKSLLEFNRSPPALAIVNDCMTMMMMMMSVSQPSIALFPAFSPPEKLGHCVGSVVLALLGPRKNARQNPRTIAKTGQLKSLAC
jgi:hypothetical protein